MPPTCAAPWSSVLLERPKRRSSALASGLTEVVAHRVAHDLRDRIGADLTHDRRAVGLDGLHTDAQHVGDVLVAMAFREQLDDLAREFDRLTAARRLGADLPPAVLLDQHLEATSHDIVVVRQQDPYRHGHLPRPS